MKRYRSVFIYLFLAIIKSFAYVVVAVCALFLQFYFRFSAAMSRRFYGNLFTGGYRGTNYRLKKSKNIYIRSE